MLDYYRIGRTAAEFLLKKGCRKPLFFCGPLKPGQRYNPTNYAHHKDKILLDGISDVLTDAKMNPWLHIFMADMDWKYLERMWSEIFSTPESRPDGIFACSDHKLVRLLRIASQCGYIPPYRIGVFDTPWSRGRAGYIFSSLALSPKACAEALVRQVLFPPGKRENVYILPELIERDESNR